jgi:hypothetical protein
MTMFENNELWQKYEKLKNRLRDAGCQGLANEIYKRQMMLEAKLTEEFVCRNSKNSSEI